MGQYRQLQVTWEAGSLPVLTTFRHLMETEANDALVFNTTFPQGCPVRGDRAQAVAKMDATGLSRPLSHLCPIAKGLGRGAALAAVVGADAPAGKARLRARV